MGSGLGHGSTALGDVLRVYQEEGVVRTFQCRNEVAMAHAATDIGEELRIIETRMKQLKLDYEQYFLGSRPREPSMQRAEIQKQMVKFANTPIKNTAERFKFNSLNSRFMTFKRQWDDTLRKIEQGTYSRHRFKADLHGSSRPETGPAAAPAPGVKADSSDLFSSYVEARQSCGQSVANLSPERLKATLAKQEAALRQRYGKAEFRFKVVVEDGRAKLKASRVT